MGKYRTFDQLTPEQQALVLQEKQAPKADVRLEALIDLMIRKRVIRIQMPDTTEVELHSSAFTAPASAEHPESSTEATDRCVCGHSLRIEHNEMGCLLGCSNSLCTGDVEARA